jgi:alkanesulfonate monooxygenase SsuD/methylene tetrahydromethanopterin reductase-like flavin-dependent oxidoreductase (luciferase family)
LFLPQLRMDFPTILERTLAAEAAGFDSVWLMDHLIAPAVPEHDSFEGWTLAAALAVRTSTIRIGHLVTCDPFRHPAVLAKMAATVDVLSGGRLELGLGWGSVEHELQMFGIGGSSRAARAARMRESITVLELMFAGEPFDHDGDDRFAELRPLAGNARASVQRPVALALDDASRAETVAVGERRFGGWGGLVAGTAPEIADALAADVAAGAEGFVLQFTDFGTPATVEHFMSEVAPGLQT